MTAVLIITILLFLCYSALIIYYRLGWLAVPNFQPSTINIQHSTRLSVIIPARNEEQNIKACLDSICNQSYPKEHFEVIVVDDHSTDSTADLVDGYAAQNIKRIALKDHVDTPLNSYKKKAIEVAIQHSSGDLIITTDADCILPENWLQTIASFYEMDRPAFIAAPVSISPAPGREASGVRWFIEIFQSLDFMVLQGITGASVYKKIHSMCNGANLAYEKKAFEEVGGFNDIDNIASGDDMLLMHKIATRYPDKVLFLKSKEAIVQTKPVKSIGEFFNQRIRWASKADKYNDKRIFFVLMLVYFFNLSLLVLPFMVLFQNIQYSIFNIQCTMMELWVVMLLLKISIELRFLYPVAKFFGRQKLLWWFPLMQPFHIIYTVLAGFLGKFGTYQWKGRKVK